MLSVMSGTVNILVDGILVGQKLGVSGLAALNLCMPVYLGLCVIGSFIVSGTSIAASTAIGRNDINKAQKLYHLSIGICLLAAAAVMIIGTLSLDIITELLCGDDHLLEMVQTYTGVTLLGAAPKILLYVPFWYLRLDGRNRAVALVMSTMAACNILLDYIFLFYLELGIWGAAVASVIAASLAVTVGFCLLCDSKSGFRFGIRFLPERGDWKQICQNGSPAALNNLAQTLRVFMVNYILSLYGMTIYVAVFAALNCISEFSLCLIQGVPQAASAMMGVYYGEKDHESTNILMKLQWKYGSICAALFGIAAVTSGDVIAMLYGIEISLYFPLLCLAIGIFPALLNGIFSNYYNVSGHPFWANMLIFGRVCFFPIIGLILLYQAQCSPWLFLVFGEAGSLLFWLFCVWVFYRRRQNYSMFLLIDRWQNENQQILDFSVGASEKEICDTCETISEFCAQNGMSEKQVVRMSLSIEELMTIILKINREQEIFFDVRLFVNLDKKGIRMRYSGVEYNPFSNKKNFQEESYLGVKMVYNMAEQVIYQRTFGMNMLQITI